MDSWIKCQDKLPTVVEALARFLGLLASSIPWPVALCSTVALSAAQKMQKCFLSWYNPFENSPEDSHSLAICMLARKICKRCWRCHNPGHVILTLEWSVGFSFFVFWCRFWLGCIKVLSLRIHASKNIQLPMRRVCFQFDFAGDKILREVLSSLPLLFLFALNMTAAW